MCILIGNHRIKSKHKQTLARMFLGWSIRKYLYLCLSEEILNWKWCHLNAMDLNVINCDILMNFKVWTTSVSNFSVMLCLFLYLNWCWQFEVNYIVSHVAFLFWESILHFPNNIDNEVLGQWWRSPLTFDIETISK
jgi:hypothetical protein